MERLSKVTFWAGLAAFVLIWSYCWTHVGQSQTHYGTRRFGLFDRGHEVMEIYADDVTMSTGSGWVGFYTRGSLVARLNLGSGLIWKELSK